jgi:hypothetical protein
MKKDKEKTIYTYQESKLSEYQKDRYDISAKRMGTKIFDYGRYKRTRIEFYVTIIFSWLIMIVVGMIVAGISLLNP